MNQRDRTRRRAVVTHRYTAQDVRHCRLAVGIRIGPWDGRTTDARCRRVGDGQICAVGHAATRPRHHRTIAARVADARRHKVEIGVGGSTDLDSILAPLEGERSRARGAHREAGALSRAHHEIAQPAGRRRRLNRQDGHIRQRAWDAPTLPTDNHLHSVIAHGQTIRRHR